MSKKKLNRVIPGKQSEHMQKMVHAGDEHADEPVVQRHYEIPLVIKEGGVERKVKLRERINVRGKRPKKADYRSGAAHAVALKKYERHPTPKEAEKKAKAKLEKKVAQIAAKNTHVYTQD